MDYLSDCARDTGLFCFQEVFDRPTSEGASIFSELQKVLLEHTGYFAPAHEVSGQSGHPISWGLALFIRKSLRVTEVGEIYVFEHPNQRGSDPPNLPRNLQYVAYEVNGQRYTVAHFHGLWTGGGKTDTDNRLEQSRKVKKFLDTRAGKKVLCGDFNLLPDTKSLAILEDGLVNLIKTYGITTTRSSLYKRGERYADYVLVSPDVTVESFTAPQIEISDHLPMELAYS